MRSVAEMLPTTSPETSTTPERIVAWITPFSPTISVSFDTISPRTRPFSSTVPENVILPSISVPSLTCDVYSRGREGFCWRGAPPPNMDATYGKELPSGVLRLLLRLALLVDGDDATRARVLHLRDVAVEEAALGDH